MASAFRRKVHDSGAVVLLLAGAMMLPGAPARAQAARPTGDASVLGDLFPNRDSTAEIRARLFVEEKADAGPVRLTLSGFAEGLVRSVRLQPDPVRSVRLQPDRVLEHTAIARLLDANLEYKSDRFALLAGLARVAWGRLDELRPTDVVNPLDVSKFFLEGRSEARLPVVLIRGRAFLSENASVEGILVPFFRRGRFDQLGESSSPFNIEQLVVPAVGPSSMRGPNAVASAEAANPAASTIPIVIDRTEPAHTAANTQGGGRFSATSGRVDWSLSAFRGFEPFGLGGVLPSSPQAAVAVVRISHPRFTMVGGDFETVRGQWGLRGEVAAFVEDSFQDPSPYIVAGSSVDAGVGVDRKAGGYRISGSIVLHGESYDAPIDSGDGPENGRQGVSLILSTDRGFAHERYNLRAFGVYNATDSSAFLRAIGRATLRDNLALEASAGWFAGAGRDLVGRFADSDFLYARVKYYF